MNGQRWISHLSYIGVGILSLLLAVFLASRIVKSSYAQAIGSGAAVTAPSQAPAVPLAKPPPVQPETQAAKAGGAAAKNIVPGIQTPPGQVGAKPISDDMSFLEPYVFDLRSGRRNPFRPPALADGTLPDLVLPGTPLERYELDELKLVGIMWDVHTPKAMFIDPQGEVHVLGKDDRIGRKRGYVAVIREGEVVVVETTNFNGENAYSTRVLKIEREKKATK